MVHIKKTWETVFFTASKKGVGSVTIELAFNHEENWYSLCAEDEEGVRFDQDTIEISKLKVEALKAALKYIEQITSK